MENNFLSAFIAKGYRIFSLDGTGMVPGGPWKVAENKNDMFWYIVNLNTGVSKRIGKVSKGRGVNYYDRAVTLANKRNELLARKARVTQ